MTGLPPSRPGRTWSLPPPPVTAGGTGLILTAPFCGNEDAAGHQAARVLALSPWVAARLGYGCHHQYRPQAGRASVRDIAPHSLWRCQGRAPWSRGHARRWLCRAGARRRIRLSKVTADGSSQNSRGGRPCGMGGEEWLGGDGDGRQRYRCTPATAQRSGSVAVATIGGAAGRDGRRGGGLRCPRHRRDPATRHGMGAIHHSRAAQRRPPPDEHPRCHPGRRPPAGADHRRHRNPDKPVAARWFQAASPATVQVWVMPHAGHTQGLATAPRAWETHVISFLDAALHPNATAAGNEPGTTAGAAAANGARLPGTDDLCRELR